MKIQNKVIDGSQAGQVQVVVDQDRSLDYERKRWLYFLSLPLMWVLTIWLVFKKKVLRIKPKINTFWVDGLSLPCRGIKEGAGSWRALDIVYNFKFGQQNGVRGKVSDYWVGIINAQAVRNRLKLVKRELAKAIREIARNEKEVRLLSLASGSAQALIEVVSDLKDINISVTLVDLDPTAIDYSRTLARKHGVEEKFTFVIGSTRSALNDSEVRPHIIEMIGFLDYRSRAKAVHLIKRIYGLLLPGGKFLTANACPNPEQHFLGWVVDWRMIYRKPEELGSIVAEGGFIPDNCQIICEPHKVHCLAICRKLV